MSATKTKVTVETPQGSKASNDERLMLIVSGLIDKDNKVVCYAVNGYTTVKYTNKVLCELHFKKRSISHVTFSQKQAELVKVLNDNKLITRIVPASYQWKFDIECLATDEFVKHFSALLTLAYNNALPKVTIAEAKSSKRN